MISTIRCGLPFWANTEEKQTTSSLIIRIIAVALGSIALLVGILALNGIPELNALGIVNSSLLTAIGISVLLTSFCLRSVKNGEINVMMPLQTPEATCDTKYNSSFNDISSLRATKTEELHDITAFENLNAGEIGPIILINGIYSAVAKAPTGERMYLAMEAFDKDRYKWGKYKAAAKFLVEGGDCGDTVGSLTEIGSHVNDGGNLKDCTSSHTFPNFWTSDPATSEKLVANLLKQKIVANSSKVKELSTIPHGSDGVNLQQQTHMAYVSKSPIRGRFKAPAVGSIADYLCKEGFSAYVDCFGDLIMSVGVNIMKKHQLVENRGIFRNPLSVVEGGYGGISMMLHSFTCMVMRSYYTSINDFMVRPLKKMGEIYINAIPKELLPQITINGIPGDQYTEGFEYEKLVIAPVEILADLHQARPKKVL